MSTKVLNKTADILAPLVFFVGMFMILLYARDNFDTERFFYGYQSQEVKYYTPSYTEHPQQEGILNVADDISLMLESLNVADQSEPEELSETDRILSYIEEITSARYSNLDTGLIKAIVYRESRYVPTHTNPKSGTVGLMQINPKWHSDRAKKLGVDDLKDPYGNILVGCDLLSELMDRYSYSYALDVYAGGYSYANKYKGTKSPVVKELERIRNGIESGTIIPGGD